MKVGFFHDHIFTKGNGVIHSSGTLAAQVWDRFFDAGAKSLIVCGRFSDSIKLGPIAERDNVGFVFSKNLSNISSLTFGSNCNEVKQAVSDVDIIVARLPSEIGFKAIKEAKKQKKKVLCEVVACPYDGLNYHGGLIAKVYAPLIRKRMQYWVNQCDAALYVTEHALQERYKCDGVKANASNVEISTVVEAEQLNSRHTRFINRVNNGAVKVGLIGTMQNDSKGIDIAIKALRKIKGVSFHILGSGNPDRFSELAINSDVTLKYDGFKSVKSDVLDWLDDVDIYIQPSFQEGLPRATIEAMSRACPIISSDAGGLSELTMDCYIHSAGDHLKLRKDIEALLHNSELMKDSSLHSISVSSKYLSSTLKKKRANFYSQFIKGNEC
ncbi:MULTISPECIES: glycosyltransferase [unclassified Pseudoalteromonas]|uniref:glycosyltransferase n=1 Tax=unclassified Pseudoalteromonas TaxID=194690 RepID=UPI0013FE0606|nr:MULTISPECIES: glycosyltransferase [unclassified Pseudoalteromonas]MBH0048912.1 glycosyltransferase family 4 protein [Pseudoalteromonas sp. SWYJZ19]